jgi:hypothetical protein
MAPPQRSPHLPRPPRNPEAYQRLYEHARLVDFVDDERTFDWQEARIPGELGASQVYRRLPSAEDIEYGGYLTKTRIRYQRFWLTSARTISWKSCTFHSHPSGHPNADIPSPEDIYHFLKWRHLRAITVGSSWIWIWNKSEHVLKTVRRLADWEDENMVGELTRLTRRMPNEFYGPYVHQVLKGLGLPGSWQRCRRPESWTRLLREHLGISTTLIARVRDRLSQGSKGFCRTTMSTPPNI